MNICLAKSVGAMSYYAVNSLYSNSDRDKSGVRPCAICTLKFTRAHGESLYAPTLSIKIL